MGGSGKDAFCNFCDEILPVFNVSSVDTIKQAARILGWNGEKDEQARYFLAHMKYLSSRYNNHPYEYIKGRIEEFQKDSSNDIMFIHIREVEEIDKIKRGFNCQTLFIDNSNIKQITSNEADAGVYHYKYDVVIDNSGSLNDLRNKAYDFMVDMFGGD